MQKAGFLMTRLVLFFSQFYWFGNLQCVHVLQVKEGNSQFFMPFEMKPNMRLAPTRRVESFQAEAKESLDQSLLKQVLLYFII